VERRLHHSRERVKQAQDAFALDPIPNAQKRGATPATHIARHRPAFGSHISPGWHNMDGRQRRESTTEIVRQRLTGNEQSLHVAVRSAIECGLDAGAQQTMVDASRRLVKHSHDRAFNACKRHERRGDAVENHDIRLDLCHSPEDVWPVHQAQRKWTMCDRDELHACSMRGREGGEASMKQVPARERAWVAKRYQGG
jgi:hypothetical protein